LRNKFALVVLGLVLIFAACSRQKEHLTLYIQWQKADTDACLSCKGSGAEAQDIHKAFETLTRQLADKGIRVELVEKKAVADSTRPEIAPAQLWIGDIPVETWLGAASQTRPCPACPVGPYGKGHVRKSLVFDDTTMDQIPVDLMVRAGTSAAEHLLQNGRIDPEKLPRGCSGCPGASSCPKATRG
jgi:hypothetical protein